MVVRRGPAHDVEPSDGEWELSRRFNLVAAGGSRYMPTGMLRIIRPSHQLRGGLMSFLGAQRSADGLRPGQEVRPFLFTLLNVTDCMLGVSPDA